MTGPWKGARHGYPHQPSSPVAPPQPVPAVQASRPGRAGGLGVESATLAEDLFLVMLDDLTGRLRVQPARHRASGGGSRQFAPGCAVPGAVVFVGEVAEAMSSAVTMSALPPGVRDAQLRWYGRTLADRHRSTGQGGCLDPGCRGRAGCWVRPVAERLIAASSGSWPRRWTARLDGRSCGPAVPNSRDVSDGAVRCSPLRPVPASGSAYARSHGIGGRRVLVAAS